MSGLGLLGRRSECETLDQLLASARSGQGRVLVLRGEAGIGKSALLDYTAARATDSTVARVVGVESEQELAYAGLHQLCAPYLDRYEQLPGPQRDALGTAFGLSAGEQPNLFLVGLAVLTLLADVAEEKPLVCLVDDAQWLDRMSALILAFVARRLVAERIVLVFASRDTGGDLADLPELVVPGLGDADARTLLDSVVKGPVDSRVRDRIVAETHGNPLALLELPKAWTTAELADGFAAVPLVSRIEQGFLRQVDPLPADTRKLLLTAAAEPLGDAALLWRAAGILGLGADPAAAAETTGLVEFGRRIRFRHPLVRSAVYRSAATTDRQDVHRALAEATDPAVDPDRRAWHRAQATAFPAEDVAADLERSAARAQARGGRVAAAAFYEQAAKLSPDPTRRARRELAAARARRDAGMLDAALELLDEVAAGPPDPLRSAEVTHVRGQIAVDRRHSGEATHLLLEAARCLTPLDPGRARETYLEAVTAAIWASGPTRGVSSAGVGAGTELSSTATGLFAAGEAARDAPPPSDPPTAVDLVLDALTSRITEGYVAAAPLFAPALAAVRDLDPGDNLGRVLWLLGNRAGGTIATEAWDFPMARTLATRQVRLARDSGALVQLQFALNFLAVNEILAGHLTDAAAMVDEDRLIADITGNPAVGYAATLLTAYRGDDSDLIATTAREAEERGQHRLVTLADYANAVRHNGQGRHDLALEAAHRVFDQDVLGYQGLATVELAEAASRTGSEGLLEAALDRATERARATPMAWSQAIETRIRALAGETQRYRESISLFAAAGLGVDVARGHLLYGEWLRREGQRVEAREHLRAAHEAFTTNGMAAFAERARRELMATGETARKRTVEPTDELTAQEFQIARLAREGFSNPEIGTRLFISPRTVEWHLRKIFGKLGISSRRQLRDAELAPA